MIVTRITGDCPKCGAQSTFGNVSVGGSRVLQGCRACNHRRHIYLPDIRKKVIYLDQLFFSMAFRGNQADAMKAADRISKLSHLQLVVAPYSSVHEDETQYFKDDKALLEFIKHTSRGHEFEPYYTVQENQIIKAFMAYMDGKPAEYDLEERDALPSRVHEWDDFFRIDVNRSRPDTESQRKLKQEAADMLVKQLDAWSASTATFEQDVQLELDDAALQILGTYRQMMLRVAGGDFSAFLNAPIKANVFQHMLHSLPRGMSKEEGVPHAVEFLKSQHFANVPSEQLSARLFATFKARVRGGAFANREKARERLSGFLHDVQHASTYAPYCDAYVTDRAMADLMKDPRVNVERDYRCKVFSLTNWPQFLAWLDDIEASATAEHTAAVKAAYPY